MRKLAALSILAMLGIGVTDVLAQPPRDGAPPPQGPRGRPGRGAEFPGPPDGPQGPGGPGSRPPLPVIQALDANNDGEISASEIENAVAALKTLDKNGDGKITRDEMRPQPGRRGREGRPNGGPGRNPDQMLDRMMQFDKDGDGRLSKDELPERMQRMLDRADTDKDGFISKEELTEMSAKMDRGGRGRRDAREQGKERLRRPEPDDTE